MYTMNTCYILCQFQPHISQFKSPCNDFTTVWSMFVYNNVYTQLNKLYLLLGPQILDCFAFLPILTKSALFFFFQQSIRVCVFKRNDNSAIANSIVESLPGKALGIIQAVASDFNKVYSVHIVRLYQSI